MFGDIAFAGVIAQEEGLCFLIVCNKFWSSDTIKKINSSNTKQLILNKSLKSQ